MECIFCKIARRELPSYLVYEDDMAIAFLDINPVSKGHTLVMPRIHVTRLSELKEKELSGLMRALQKVVKGIEDSLKPEGLNIAINQGEVAGQVVPHLHVHLVPRTRGDGLKIPSFRKEMSKEEFQDVSSKIASRLKV